MHRKVRKEYGNEPSASFPYSFVVVFAAAVTNFVTDLNKHEVRYDMNRLFAIPLIALLMASFLFPVAIVADNAPSQTVTMQKKSKEDSDHNERLDPEPHSSYADILRCKQH